MGQMQPYRSKYGDTITDLIARRGDIAAQGHLASGAIWGNAVQNVGNIAATAVGDYAQVQQQKEQDRQARARDIAIAEVLQSEAANDPQALYKALLQKTDPKTAMAIASGAASLQKMSQAKDPKDAMAMLPEVARAFQAAPDGLKPGLWRVVRESVLSANMAKPEEMPEQYDPETAAGYVQYALGMEKQAPVKPVQEVVETIGPDGRPVKQLVGEDALRAGVPVYQKGATPAVGSFEDYVTQKFGERPNPQQIAQARKEYQQADDRPRPPNPLEAIPPEWKSVSGRAGMAMPEKRRNAFEATLASVAHDPQQMGDVIRQAAIEGENVDVKNQIIGRQSTIASLEDTRAMLAELKAKGVPTSWMSGTMEDLHRKLGSSTNPEYVALSNRLMGTLINYRRAATGVSFGAKESGDYERMFPNYRNTPPVNEALIKGLLREMKSYDKTYWEHKLGKEGAKLVGVVKDEPSAASLPATTKSELDRIFGGGK